MTAAPPLSADERARVAAFDAAPQLAESSPIVRAVLAKCAAMEAEAPIGRFFAEEFRRVVADALAADPEPREGVIERMARAMWAAEAPDLRWEVLVASVRVHWRRLAAVALDASRGGAQ